MHVCISLLINGSYKHKERLYSLQQTLVVTNVNVVDSTNDSTRGKVTMLNKPYHTLCFSHYCCCLLFRPFPLPAPPGPLADQREVAATTVAWADTVTSGTYDAPKKAAALYAADAVLWGTEVCGPDDELWGTVSESVRDTPPQIYAYFVSFMEVYISFFRWGCFCFCRCFLAGAFFLSVVCFSLAVASVFLFRAVPSLCCHLALYTDTCKYYSVYTITTILQ